MKIKIRWRCDDEEYYCTDSHVYEVATWNEVVEIIDSIERRHTVLDIERVDV